MPRKVIRFDPASVSPLSDIDAAWCAGIIEGEGCIRLQVSDVKDTRTGLRLKSRVTMSVVVSMKDGAVVRRFARLSGVDASYRPDGLASCTVSSRRAMWLLPQLVPHMVGDKLPQATLAIEFQSGRVPGVRTTERHEWELKAAALMSNLKKVGVYERRKGPRSPRIERITAAQESGVSLIAAANG